MKDCFLFILYGNILPLIMGRLLDKLLGDPSWLPHPVVGFGKLIACGERWLNRGDHRALKGGLLAVALILSVFTGSVCLLYWADGYAGIALKALFIFYCLAGTTLIREVRMVFEALENSLEEGRRQVARIVGRDTTTLSAQEVRTAALETLAENLSDGVIAPLFWYMLLGVPGMLAYKMINTLDSMIGYKNDRYLLFGRVAARIDDAANYLPARLTAWLMLLAGRRLSLWAFVRKHGREHASPNSGYPEAALAGMLDCRFGGSHNYFGKEVWKPFIGSHERILTTADMYTSVRINQRAEIFMLIVALAGRSYLLLLFL